MEQAEILHSLGALTVDIALDGADLHGVVDAVAGVVAIRHDVTCDDGHAVERAHTAAVLAVAPRRVIKPVGEAVRRQHGRKEGRSDADVGDLLEQIRPADPALHLAHKIVDKHGHGNGRQQLHEHHVAHLTGQQKAIEHVNCQIDQAAGKHITQVAQQRIARAKAVKHGAVAVDADIPINGDRAEINAHPEDVARRAVKLLRSLQHEPQRKAKADQHRQQTQEAEAPEAGHLAEAEREHLHHDRCQRCRSGEPSQRIFPTDVISDLIHSSLPFLSWDSLIQSQERPARGFVPNGGLELAGILYVFQDDKLGQKTHGAPQPIDSEVFWRHYTIFAPFRQEKRTDAERRPSSNS